MTAVEVLSELRRRGVELKAAGDRIRYRPVGAVTPELRAALNEHKAELLALLCDSVTVTKPRPTTPPAGVLSEGMPQILPRQADDFRPRVPDVPAGWTPKSWAERLRYLAGVCTFPKRAAELAAWAGDVERYSTRTR